METDLQSNPDFAPLLSAVHITKSFLIKGKTGGNIEYHVHNGSIRISLGNLRDLKRSITL
jgi:hypothetical protein